MSEPSELEVGTRPLPIIFSKVSEPVIPPEKSSCAGAHLSVSHCSPTFLGIPIHRWSSAPSSLSALSFPREPPQDHCGCQCLQASSPGSQGLRLHVSLVFALKKFYLVSGIDNIRYISRFKKYEKAYDKMSFHP